jgi:15,16-dihydrobiliverdin:ferredoxin oxidoreductase
MYEPFRRHLELELGARYQLEELPIPEGLQERTSERGRNKAKIRSWHYGCRELRKIRYTYIDAGESAQIFNSVIYPSYDSELPFLGIDFLSFGNVKNLIVMDFQPLFQDDADLSQDLEMKFYDANQYFSKYLLFAKTDAETVRTRVFEAYKEYLGLYWDLVAHSDRITDDAGQARIQKAQKDYDQYSAERDPASGLFSSYFGEEWSERFLYEFLFADATPVTIPTKR